MSDNIDCVPSLVEGPHEGQKADANVADAKDHEKAEEERSRRRKADQRNAQMDFEASTRP